MAYNQREVALVVAVAVLACMAVTEAISCGAVSSSLSPCLSYMTQPSIAAPSGGCCSGVKSLYGATRAARGDRVTSCGCIKTLASALGDKLNTARIGGLPGKCGVNLGFTISINTDCNKVP